MLLDTSYLGMRLPHPFVAGASPFGYRVDTVKRLEDAGWAAVVLHSLFEEQVTMEREGRIAHLNPDDQRFSEMIGYFPKGADYRFGPHEYAEHLYRTTQAVTIPVIGSINGHTRESWLTYARMVEQAGAAALEVNWYDVATNPRASGYQMEDDLVEMVRDLKGLLKIPVAIKLSPFFTAFANVARQLDEAGADALVLFNRFYQPDIDIKTMQVVPRLELSTSAELPLRLRWIAILCGRVRASLAITGGVTTPHDGIKAVLAGADAIQMVSAILHHGPSYVVTMRHSLEQWLEWNNLGSLAEARGRLSHRATQNPSAYERAQYIRVLHSWGAPAA
ncbi:MAG TPA: dihydroorotate dehydrogenase-like protein [Vicinamibacterales bacterium]|jgi:dihydroorotate dehydrogenase (fumarate)|nr:dihydroorotate dehydrogenase-like protein [Vicinamibacterales bacterium]